MLVYKEKHLNILTDNSFRRVLSLHFNDHMVYILFQKECLPRSNIINIFKHETNLYKVFNLWSNIGYINDCRFTCNIF